MSDKMFRKCPDCSLTVAICAVSEFHNVGGFNGYSYSMNCSCGMRMEIDGCDGDEIPESMKIAAAEHRNNHQIHRAIDFDRRDLPQSNAKATLKQSKLSAPKPDIEGSWVVYRLPNGAEILFSVETAKYTFRYNDVTAVYSDFNSLVELHSSEIAT
ncbi:hypothetical protein CA13_17820 [Planctomycetes bacterium CA13]|uniref:Uncharacterized protein n=1 Tax=Novipirellula herctigrandis TaxID=2527986 RepID=A0A5C5YZ46_9BACT|nr:hypothetical protein CA13_17820 [Planctomycetes bacterium CA13]